MPGTTRTHSPRRAALASLTLAAAASFACAALLGGCIAIPLNSQGSLFPRPKATASHDTSSGVSIEATAAGVGEAQTGGSWRVTVVKARAKTAK